MNVTSNYEYDVFVSYSSKDRVWVKDVLLKWMEDNQIRVCIDYRDFIPGMPPIKNIERAIVKSHKSLLVITQNYLESSWTSFETSLLQTADPANERLRFIPILKEKCNFYLGFAQFTYLNFVDSEDENKEWERLLRAIKGPPSSPKSEVVRLQECMKVVYPSENELRNLCFEAPFEDVGRNLRDIDRWDYIAREIISYCKGRGFTDILWDLMRQRNPNVTYNHEI
nr:toll/interleukin-1 receptor domain-containing protein [Desulfobacula sp.]